MKSASATATTRSDNLAKAMELNKRLNCLFSIMNRLDNSYSYNASAKIQSAQMLEQDIATQTAALNVQYDLLKSDTSAIMNHKTMIRYGEEKNNYVTNQISLWGALNILALGTIFYVYRQM
jgi:hypothetical protein